MVYYIKKQYLNTIRDKTPSKLDKKHVKKYIFEHQSHSDLF